MSSGKAASLNAYRNALRATRIAFNQDTATLAASREQIRNGFRNPDTSKAVEERIKHIEEISRFLRRNVVQGKLEDPENAPTKYKLNIHEETELGDNDSVKKAKKILMDKNQGCCGGSSAKI
ncbi:Mzm1p [Ascoidea rubescens DSM 1968]|uniref:Mitochondrial zinc maintenance protein 1, mitochondrial n=1 Tax=Ascoidea rubescens DSM 1968 TaxID=1344418 RepID=A0A1D2V9A5_9ASCO|nr:mitochondrial zinc maintenance protein 1, mitochondrial [Ascoidea rubescens DSM 1968]ODV58230.1 mitochondrial zinc maintenance protein 1, mitochondrial [Ascoidea rubescens DSM 1968]